MKSYIVINSSIYRKYKEDILPLNARLFCDEHFYNLDNYNVPLDLKGVGKPGLPNNQQYNEGTTLGE